MEREYHPRNISEFKKGDLVMRVEPASLPNHEDCAWIYIPLNYWKEEEDYLFLASIKDIPSRGVEEGSLIKLNTRYWSEGWDYVNPEDELKKKKKEESKSTLKNTNLTAFLGRSK